MGDQGRALQEEQHGQHPPRHGDHVLEIMAGNRVVSSAITEGRRIERLQRHAAGVTLDIGPDRNRIEVGMNEVQERQRRMGRRYASRHAAADDWKCMPQPVEYELSERVPDRLPAAAEQAGGSGPGQGTVSRGQTEGERVGEFLDREPGVQGELQGHYDVVGVELRLYDLSMLPSFWKMENAISTTGFLRNPRNKPTDRSRSECHRWVLVGDVDSPCGPAKHVPCLRV